MSTMDTTSKQDDGYFISNMDPASTQNDGYPNGIVRDSPVGGKGLFSFRDAAAGEGIINIRRPLVTALDNRRLHDTCANCYEWTADVFFRELIDEFEPPKLQVCAGCKTLRYCSKRCQSESWKGEHKRVCKLLSKLNQKGTLPNAGRAVLRMLQIAAYEHDVKGALMGMKSHLNEITARGGERAETLLVMSTGIHEYSGTPFGHEYVQNFFAIVLTNSLTIWTATMDPMGIAVDPLAAKANHSCDPNAVVVWDGAQLQFRSLKPIKEGDEIFISYIDPTQPYSRRQHELDEKFYFKCKCSKCEAQWSGPSDKFLKTPNSNHSYGGHMMMADAREDIAMPIMQEMRTKELPSSNPDFLGTTMPHADNVFGLFKGLKGLAFAQKIAYACYKASTVKGELEHMALLNTGLQACIGTKLWPDDRQPVPMIRQNALCNYLILANRFTESYIYAFLQALKLYFDCFPKLYPQTFHPLRVINKWTLANVALVLAAGSEVNSQVQDLTKQGLDLGVVVWGFLKETFENVQYSHGTEHRFSAAVKRKSAEVWTDMTRADGPAHIQWAEGQIEKQWKVLRKIAKDPRINDYNQFREQTERGIRKMQEKGQVA